MLKDNGNNTLKIFWEADLWRKPASEVLTVGQLDSGPLFVLTRVSSSLGFDVGQLLWFQSSWWGERERGDNHFHSSAVRLHSSCHHGDTRLMTAENSACEMQTGMEVIFSW